MKKVRLFLAAGACCLAGAAVFANSSVTIKYYRTPNPGSTTASDCSTPFTGTLCTAGTAVQCKVVINDVDVWITQKDDASPTAPCNLYKRIPV